MVGSVQNILLNNNIKFETCRLIVTWLCNYYEIVILNTLQQNVVIWKRWEKKNVDKMCCQSMITKWHIKSNYNFVKWSN
jgi:hypothetical protein